MFGAVELEEADDSLFEGELAALAVCDEALTVVVRPYLGMPHSEVLVGRACGRAEVMVPPFEEI